MTGDLHTLIMPTYNRPEELRRNLIFQDAQGISSRILVLDSSRRDIQAINRNAIEKVDLLVEHIQYDPAIHPFDKFADGIARAVTPFASLCPDDDLLLLPGLKSSLRALTRNPSAVVAHGYYFLFGNLHNQLDLDITTMLYASPSIDEADPIRRLRTLMNSYQALTYGVFRTEILRDVYRDVRRLDSLMFRELLSSALPTLQGTIIRVPDFYMARAHATGDDAARKYWHPLEWFMRDSETLIKEYASYRAILIDSARRVAPTHYPETSLERLIDLIHLGYLIKHMPQSARTSAFEQEIAGRTIDEYWSDPGLQQALVTEHNSEFISSGSRKTMMTRRVADFFQSNLVDPVSGQVASWPLIAKTYSRDYRFHQGFLDNQLSEIVPVDGPILRELINTLDLYLTG